MRAVPLLFAALAALLLSACQSPLLIDVHQARLADTLEVQVDGSGALVEIEYHTDPASVPEIVRQAMDRLHPGGPFSDAEIEFHEGILYYELSRSVDGLEVEAMFTAASELFSEEIEVRAASVPEAVRAAITRLLPGGQVTKYEEIHDGTRQLLEYHVKVNADGRRHKVIVSLDGKVQADLLEMVAEIEVPAR